MNQRPEIFPSRTVAYPLPDQTGAWPEREVFLLTVAANLAFVAAFSHYHHFAPVWKLALVILVCLLLPLGYLLLLRVHARNHAMREVWNEKEAELYEAVFQLVSRLIALRKNSLREGSLVFLGIKWDGLYMETFAEYPTCVRWLMRGDMLRLNVVDLINEQLEGTEEIVLTDLLVEEVYVKVHRRYVGVVRPDGLLWLVALAAGNVVWMVCWW